jgi:murein DD-endopeptidase MepM/ murein hydrolase activator NlpD
LDLKIIVPNSDFINMKKNFIIKAAILFMGGSLWAASLLTGCNGDTIDDAIRLEDSIIIHGIEMESDSPPDEGDGRIIYDDSFGDAIADHDAVKRERDAGSALKKNMTRFNELAAKDPRWHLVGYKIMKTDNLWNIARRFGSDHRLVIQINGINDPDMLRPGRHLLVPTRNGVYYQVKKGDTVSMIAARYRASIKKVLAHNRLEGGSLIRPGQRIFLPDVSGPVKRRTVIPAQKKETAFVAAGLRGLIWPLKGRITSGFGNRTDPLSGLRRFHCGIDISANMGTPVHAVSNGRIIFSGWKPGYGNVVIIRHRGGYISVYAHNSKNLLPVDRVVKKGDTIAYSGMTGAVTGAHLHFELRKYVTPLNPLRFLP